MKSGMADALTRARAYSPFLATQIEAFPAIVTLIAEDRTEGLDQALAAALALGTAVEGEPLARRLRKMRRAVSLVAGLADLAGYWSLEQVTKTLSDLADSTLDMALTAALAQRYPDTQSPAGIAVIALGKHGSRELNYSSDIDPILLFDPDQMPHGPREEPQEAAVRVARNMVALLSERDADGFVFRVDLRLRPAPEVSPIILPVEAAITHYESAAAGWEQAAFIRARAAAGDMALGESFLAAIRPFVWRRSLDFGAVEAITDVSRRIREHYAGGQAFGPGFDLKRGRGGIREVEFFAQVQQLIHGGRNLALRAPATRDALAALAAAEILSAEECGRLDAAYVQLRTIEHRLQMVDDRQTHSLPVRVEALDQVARLHGLKDGAALLDSLRPTVEAVGTSFDTLAQARSARTQAALPREREALIERIGAAGFADSEIVATRIGRWREGSLRALRSPAAQDALEQLLPLLLPALAEAPAPLAALNRLDDVLSGLPSAINFLRLLVARPGLAEILALILAHAPALAEALGQRPALFDGLIDASAFAPQPDVAILVQELLAGVEDGADFQMLLDHVRIQVGERRFALGVQILRGESDPLEAAAGYARVAEAAITVLGAAVTAQIETAHGKVPGGELVILALGRFGGGLLTHASDLDLVYLFTGDFAAESDGARPLGATQYFNRLAQRIGPALSVPTAAGPLYEVDTRLRPSGHQGLLAVSFESFAQYQVEAAWTWEHLALTRARPLFGSPAARAEIAAIINAILCYPRDAAAVWKAAVTMRADMARHKPPKGDLDVKLMPGGLVDLEFLVHVTQLITGRGLEPDLGTAIAALVAGDDLPAELGAAHDLLTRYLVVSRLVTPQSARPPVESQPLVAQACGAASWSELLAQMDAARQSIATAWGAVVARAELED
jgi:[glutamine synthetase] adenylyltransferase / [glutamine synthetase]-adenylyl-L-tyrosine phosphorylase